MPILKSTKLFFSLLFLHSTFLTMIQSTHQVLIETSQEIERCSICLTDFEPKESPQTLKCSHNFHAACINEWYTTSGKLTCPLCRADNGDIIEEFTQAIDTNDSKTLRKILEQHRTLANYIFDTETKITALHRAAQKGHPAIIRWLVRFAGNPNARNSFGEIPLHLAAAAGHWEAVEELCQLNSFVDARDQIGCTALHCAAAGGWTKTVNVLLQHLYKQWVERDHDRAGYRQLLNAQTYFKKQTALHCAIESTNANTAKALLKRRVDQHLCDWKGKTPLNRAVLQGSEAMVNVLFQHRMAGVH